MGAQKEEMIVDMQKGLSAPSDYIKSARQFVTCAIAQFILQQCDMLYDGNRKKILDDIVENMESLEMGN